MRVTITPYTDSHREGVSQFNQRMTASGEGEYQLPKDLRQFEDSADGPLPWEGWLAEEDGVVRGGYLLRWQDFSFRGEIRRLAFYNLSVSEGAIDRKYAPVSRRMIMSAISRAPLMFALGMGGIDKRLPRFLQTFGWKLYEIPFLFRAVRPGRVVRNIQTMRAAALRRALLDIAAFTGVAWAGMAALRAVRARAPRNVAAHYEEVPAFDRRADSVWNQCSPLFGMIGMRDSSALDALYPQTMPRITRLWVNSGAGTIGWAVVLNTQMKGHKQFGDLHVGTIVDVLSRPADAHLVTGVADRFLESKGVDMVVSNQCHRAFSAALLDRGFLKGPSNYALAASQGLTELLAPFDSNISEVHLTRGDGDGPIHL